MAPRVAGAVLTGGSSTRMGRDKTLIPLDGSVLAARAVVALRAAGIGAVRCIGGDGDGLTAAGLAWLPDLWPGEGPLGGILTAFDVLVGPAGERADVVVVLAGDLAAPSPDAIRAIVDALGPGDDLAVAVLDDRPQWLHAAWRPDRVAPTLRAAFDAGERSIHRAAASLALRPVEGIDGSALRDIDTPEDLTTLSGSSSPTAGPTGEVP